MARAVSADRRADVLAGLSIAGLLLPEAVAYAGIAGLPPQAGLVGLLAGALCYGLIGRSPVAIVAATSSSAAVLGAATLSIAGSDAATRVLLAAGLVLLTGATFILAAVMRLGSISAFVSRPVLRGFAFGLALTITIRQLAKMSGAHPTASDLLHFTQQWLVAWPHWSPAGLAFGLAALVLLVAFRRWPLLPGPLLVIAIGIIADQRLGLSADAVPLVGPIRLLVGWPGLPDLPHGAWLHLAELAFAIALLLFAESWGAIRGNVRSSDTPPVPDRELWALGAANLVSGLFHGTPVGAGYSATSANAAAGAASRTAASIAAAAVLLLCVVALPWVELTPEPVLAAIVIAALRHALDPAAFAPYFRWRRDRVAAVAAALAVVLLGIVDGLLAGVAVSLLMTLRDLSTPRISELGRIGDGHDFLSLAAHPDARPIPELIVLRPEAPLFFGNAERMLADARRRIGAMPLRAAVLSLEETYDLDASALEALGEFSAAVQARGISLVLARLKDPVLALLLVSGLPSIRATLLEAGSVDDAVRRALGASSGQSVTADREATSTSR